IAANFEFARQNDFYAAGRPNLRVNQNFVVVDADPANSPNGSDGIPDRLFFRDIRSSLFSNGGTFLSCCQAGPSPGVFTIPYLFQPDGTLALQTGERVGLSPFGSVIGGSGDNFRDGTQFGLSPKLDRYSVNVIGHYQVSDASVPFFQA